MTKEERLIRDGFGLDSNPVEFFSPRRQDGHGSNFSQHPVRLTNPFTGKVELYQTGEHRFQAMKATRLEDHTYVQNQPTPTAAKDTGRRILLRDGWGNSYGDLCWFVMFETILAKTIQNENIERWLKTTKDRPIYEDSPYDDIWGWRYQTEYNGKNLLGRCWMDVREIIV